MPYKIQEQEFNWVSLVGTWKCKTKEKYICICSVSLWKEHISSHSPPDNICLFSSSTSCVKDVYPQTPQVTYCAGYLLVVLQCQAHPLSLLYDTGAGACVLETSDSLAGGARFLSRNWTESERQAAGRRGFLLPCPVPFTDNRR